MKLTRCIDHALRALLYLDAAGTTLLDYGDVPIKRHRAERSDEGGARPGECRLFGARLRGIRLVPRPA